MPMPEPKYIDIDKEAAEGEENESLAVGVNGEGTGGGRGGARYHRAGWLELFCRAAAGDIVRSAASTVSMFGVH